MTAAGLIQPMRSSWPLAIVLVVGWASAEPAPRREVRLEYQVESSTPACPTESAFRSSVAARLGYDPFVSSARRAAMVSLTGRASSRRAVVTLLDEAGTRLGEKQLSSTDLDCAELAASAALALSIAIDPLSLTGRPAEHDAGLAPAEPDAGVASAIEPPSDAGPSILSLVHDGGTSEPPTLAPQGPNVEVAAAPTVSLGHQPTVAAGLLVEVRASWHRFSLGLDARVELPSEFAFGRGSIRTVVFGAGLTPCGTIGSFELCGVLVAGAMRSAGNGFSTLNEATTPELMAGVRGAFRLALSDRLALRFFADGLARLVSVSLLVGDQRAWTSPILAGLLGVAAIYRW